MTPLGAESCFWMPKGNTKCFVSLSQRFVALEQLVAISIVCIFRELVHFCETLCFLCVDWRTLQLLCEWPWYNKCLDIDKLVGKIYFYQHGVYEAFLQAIFSTIQLALSISSRRSLSALVFSCSTLRFSSTWSSSLLVACVTRT